MGLQKVEIYAGGQRQMYDLTDAAVVYNGIDTTVFKGGADRREISDGEIKILHIGRFDPAKNHELLIDAFALLLKNFPGVKLQLVGDGEFKARVMEKVVKNNLVNHVDFLGVIKDIPGILAVSNILVLSSVAEGFGLVLVEAMAMGLPVVATNVGGVKEIAGWRQWLVGRAQSTRFISGGTGKTGKKSRTP